MSGFLSGGGGGGLTPVPVVPEIYSTLAGTASTAQFDIHDGYLYTCTGTNLLIYSIFSTLAGNSFAPVLVSTTAMGVTGTGLQLAGKYAYVIADDTLKVVDVSNVAAPSVVATLTDTTTLNQAISIQIAGTTAFIACNLTPGRVTSVDISDPTTPVVLQSLTDAAMNGAREIALCGDYVYVAAFDASGIAVVDISSPSAMSVAGSSADAGFYGSPTSIQVSGKWVFTVGDTGLVHKLIKADISNPAAIVDQEELVFTSVADDAYKITLLDNVIYMTTLTANPGRVIVVNLADNLNTVVSLNLAAGASPGSYIKAQGRYAFTWDGAGALNMLDLQTAEFASLTTGSLKTNDIDNVGIIRTDRLDARYLTVSGSNVATSFLPQIPTTPNALAASAILTTGQEVVVRDNLAFVVDSGANSIRVISVANPASPALISTTAVGTTPVSCDLYGNYVAVAVQAQNRLVMLDISNPASPSIAGTLIIAGSAPQKVRVVGNYAYLIDSTLNNLYVIDISTPTAPTLVSTTSTVSTVPQGLDIKWPYAYITAFTTGALRIFDISNPASPSSVGVVAGLTQAGEVVVNDSWAYVQRYDGNVSAVNVSNPTAPSVSNTLAVASARGLVRNTGGRYLCVTVLAAQGIQWVNISVPTAIAAYTTGSAGAALNQAYINGRYLYATNAGTSFYVYDLNGAEIVSANIGQVYTGQLDVSDVLRTNTLDVKSGATFGNQVQTRGGFAGSLTLGSGQNISSGRTTATGTGLTTAISGGPGGATSGNGGPVTITGGTPIEGNGGAVSLSGANGVGTNRAGGAITVAGGNATGTGNAGNITVLGGTGGNTSGAGGSSTLQGGSGGTNLNGGAVLAIGGAGNGSGNGGAAFLTGGSAGATGTGGAMNIDGGPGGLTSGRGGHVVIQGGTPTDGAGGNVTITGKDAAGAGNNNGGSVTITAGQKTNSGTSGNIMLASGDTTSNRWSVTTLGDFEKQTQGNYILTERRVVANTTDPLALTHSDSFTCYTNEGGTANINFTLPAAAAGLQYTFIVQDADGLQVDAVGNDTIRIATAVSGAAGNIASTTIGSTVTLLAINGVEWISIATNGTWVVT